MVRAVMVLPQPLRFDMRTDRRSEVNRRCGHVGRNDSLLLRLPSLHSVLGRGEKPSFILLSARARLLLRGAKVAELVSASACHVVAP